MNTLEEILELSSKLQILIQESAKVSESIRNKRHYFTEDEDLNFFQKSNLDLVLNNLTQLSIQLDDKKEFVSKEEIETIIKSYNEIIVNLKEWKKIKFSIIPKLNKTELEELEVHENIFLSIIDTLRKNIESAGQKTKNMKLQLAIKRLINWIDEESKLLKEKSI